jgi:hypothetical protein
MRKANHKLFSEQKCLDFEARIEKTSNAEEIIQALNDEIDGVLS